MKVLILGGEERYKKFMPKFSFIKDIDIVFLPKDSSNKERLKVARDADVIFADAIAKIDKNLIRNMPDLKMISSEGVAFNCIDIDTARELGIYVVNNKGCNDSAVAEMAIMLMLESLRNGIIADKEVRCGNQMKFKEASMVSGVKELSECLVGLIGFGDTAKAVATRLHAFGSQIFYTATNKKSPDIESIYHAKFLSLDELLMKCDIISIHVPVTEKTRKMINSQTISKMKQGALLINTSRGEIVDNKALYKALLNGHLSGAGLDTVYPEPMTIDNILLSLPSPIASHIVFSGHNGGITDLSFRRAHEHMWNNVEHLMNNERPTCIVNGL